MADIGAFLLKMQADEISRHELKTILEELRDNPAFRKRCTTLGYLLADTGIEERQSYARDCVSTLLAMIDPNGESVCGNVNVTSAFYRHCPILRRSGW
jgi:hypothetical protein